MDTGMEDLEASRSLLCADRPLDRGPVIHVNFELDVSSPEVREIGRRENDTSTTPITTGSGSASMPINRRLLERSTTGFQHSPPDEELPSYDLEKQYSILFRYWVLRDVRSFSEHAKIFREMQENGIMSIFQQMRYCILMALSFPDWSNVQKIYTGHAEHLWRFLFERARDRGDSQAYAALCRVRHALNDMDRQRIRAKALYVWVKPSSVIIDRMEEGNDEPPPYEDVVLDRERGPPAYEEKHVLVPRMKMIGLPDPLEELGAKKSFRRSDRLVRTAKAIGPRL